jgi:hypothetical protein
MSAAASVADAISAGGYAVDVVVEGRRLVVVFTPDAAEHQRRADCDAGAVKSRRLLHALWALPADLRWPASAVTSDDVATLEHEGPGFVTVADGHVERHYRPAGRVDAIVTCRRHLSDAVAAAASFPPVFRRYAMAERTPKQTADMYADAEQCGVGILLADGTHGPVPAAEPIVGVPAVYRWWLAEVAYDAWLPPKAH